MEWSTARCVLPRRERSRWCFPSKTRLSYDPSVRGGGTIRALAWSVGLGAIYTVVAKLGLALGAVSGFATLVWPPTGISLTAILLLGYRVWPGVAAGALAVNLWVGAPPGVAVGIAIGNTAEALIGAFALRRLIGFRHSLSRLRDVLGLIGLAAVASTLVSAGIGVASLWLGGVVATPRIGETWEAWWVGDMMGDLIVAPLLLTLFARTEPWKAAPLGAARIAEGLVLGVLLASSSALLFAGPAGSSLPAHHAYMIFPLLIWAALSFGTRGASTAVFVVSTIAVAGAVMGGGPFAGPHLSASLLELQTFMAIVAATTLILGSVSEERRRALAMRESLISLAAHELKTPLTSLLLRIQKLGRSMHETAPSGSGAARDLDAVEGLVKRTGRLVDDLLDASRMTAGQLPLDLEDLELAALVRAIVERLPESQQALLSVVAPAEPIVGRWDRLRVDQIITNLVSNALKYGENRAVIVRIERAGNRARVTVQDHGVGIAKQDLERIFERFERAAAKNISGFGVGLWIVRQMVEALGGRVGVQSRIGTGSAFVVELPLGFALSPRTPPQPQPDR
jgi:signal transduction histidine kinase